jgi:hypothetical protein
MKTIRDKMKDANLKITELSFYLGVSRPTLYNFIDLYIQKEYQSLEKRVYDLLTFIDNTKPLSNAIVLNYMINNQISKNVIMSDDNSVVRDLRSLQNSDSSQDKLKYKIVEKIIKTDDLDFIIEPLDEYSTSSKKSSIDGFIKYINKKKGE